MVIVLCVALGLGLYFLMKDKRFFSSKSDAVVNRGYETIDDRYNTNQKEKERELNELLDKVNVRGFDKLSDRERKRLKELSK